MFSALSPPLSLSRSLLRSPSFPVLCKQLIINPCYVHLHLWFSICVVCIHSATYIFFNIYIVVPVETWWWWLDLLTWAWCGDVVRAQPIATDRLAVDKLLNWSCVGLTSEQQKELHALVHSLTDIFATSERDCTHTNIVQHQIDTGDVLPIRMWLRRLPFMEEKLRETV